MEVRNRFKGLDLIDRVPDELWTEVRDIVQETGIKTIPMKKKCKKAKWFWGGLTNTCEKKRSKRQRRKGKLYRFECRVPKNSKERQESLPQWSMQRNKGKKWNGKDHRSLPENQRCQGTFHVKMGTIKHRESYMYLTEAEDNKKRWQEYIEKLYKKRS